VCVCVFVSSFINSVCVCLFVFSSAERSEASGTLCLRSSTSSCSSCSASWSSPSWRSNCWANGATPCCCSVIWSQRRVWLADRVFSCAEVWRPSTELRTSPTTWRSCSICTSWSPRPTAPTSCKSLRRNGLWWPLTSDLLYSPPSLPFSLSLGNCRKTFFLFKLTNLLYFFTSWWKGGFGKTFKKYFKHNNWNCFKL